MRLRILAVLFAASVALAVLAQSAPERPKITGISHLAIYTSNPAATEHYYRDILGAVKESDSENPQGVRYVFTFAPWEQFIEVLPLPPNAGVNRMDHVAFNTTDAEGMRKYLAAKGWKTPSATSGSNGGEHRFTVLDPEGNKIEFITPGNRQQTPGPPKNAVGHHIIHVGFVVHDRAREDAFYRDLLGFRPYWYGGMQEGKIDWVSQQVPDGHDWLEYMVTSSTSGSGMSQQLLGVLDHFSIGEVSVPDAYKALADSNRLDCKHDQGPKIGRDGKYQFNMYDPDGIRAELMNFHATEKPCCSPFTAADPAE